VVVGVEVLVELVDVVTVVDDEVVPRQ
jgi:hypothetical protein